MWLALADGLGAQGFAGLHRVWLALADTIAGAKQGISPDGAKLEGQERAGSIRHQAVDPTFCRRAVFATYTH